MSENTTTMSRQQRVAGFILAVPMLLLAIWGYFVFTFFLHTNFLQWIMYNVCAPTEIIFFLLFLFSGRKPERLYIILLPLLFFGTIGLFIFPWSGQGALTAQISHILMTCAAGFILYINKRRAVSPQTIYWMIFVTILIAVQQRYCYVTADTLSKLLNI